MASTRGVTTYNMHLRHEILYVVKPLVDAMYGDM